MAEWLQGAIGYQVYIRSFADSDGDGLGDLPGVTDRLPHLADLGIDVVWVTPFYPSPDADHGYDVSDHRAVDPRFGTLEDVRTLCHRAHDLGLRVMADLVPNHVSDQHAWFRGALAGDEQLQDRFVIVPGAAEDGPPNNWVSHFGGPAWTHREEFGGWYMHLFLPEQPDLDWSNQVVREEHLDLLRHWFEIGLDGMRIDVAHSLLEDPELRDNPWRSEPPGPGATPSEVFLAMEHRHDLDHDETPAVYETWREVADEYDAALLGETYLFDASRVARYVGRDRLQAAFWFETLRTGWDHDAITSALTAGLEATGDRTAWPLSSHDDPHAAERFGGGGVGARRAQAYLTVLVGLPGVTFLFQGDELGLDDGVLDTVQEDPIARNSGGAESRDGSRTPMPWGDGPHLGFTTGTPWLPLGENRDRELHTVAAQRGAEGSWLETTRRLLHVRRDLPDLVGSSEVVWLDRTDPVLAFRRGDTVVACCIGADGARVELPTPARLLHASVDGARVDGVTLHLPADAAAIVALEGQGAG